VIVPNWIGGDYVSQSQFADCEQTVNWYTELIESGAGKSRAVLYRTPGTSLFGTNPDYDLKPARGAIEYDGRYFRINGEDVLEVFADGSNRFLGNVLNDGNMAQLASNSAGQIAIASGGELYIITIVDGLLTHIPQSDDFFGAAAVTYGDSYFIVLSANLSQFQISDFNNGMVWSAEDVSGRIPMTDATVNLIYDRGLLWIFSGRQAQLWADTGNNNFPFAPMGSAFMEMGLGAKSSLCQFDNALIFLGQDIRGARMVFKAQGASPVRASNHSMEYAMSKYSRVDDAVAFVRQDRGHTFYRLTFPTANATWELDAQTGLWCKLTFTDLNGNQYCRQERDHVYCFGKHLVGLGGGTVVIAGTVMELSPEYYYDQAFEIISTGPGQLLNYPITRDRICPLPNNENRIIFLTRFELEFEPGIGLDGSDNTNPQFMLRNSWDDGKTWGNELMMSAGGIGQYNTRAYINRLGCGRKPAVWVRVTEPCNFTIINAYMDVSAGAY